MTLAEVAYQSNLERLDNRAKEMEERYQAERESLARERAQASQNFSAAMKNDQAVLDSLKSLKGSIDKDNECMQVILDAVHRREGSYSL